MLPKWTLRREALIDFSPAAAGQLPDELASPRFRFQKATSAEGATELEVMILARLWKHFRLVFDANDCSCAPSALNAFFLTQYLGLADSAQAIIYQRFAPFEIIGQQPVKT